MELALFTEAAVPELTVGAKKVGAKKVATEVATEGSTAIDKSKILETAIASKKSPTTTPSPSGSGHSVSNVVSSFANGASSIIKSFHKTPGEAVTSFVIGEKKFQTKTYKETNKMKAKTLKELLSAKEKSRYKIAKDDEKELHHANLKSAVNKASKKNENKRHDKTIKHDVNMHESIKSLIKLASQEMEAGFYGKPKIAKDDEDNVDKRVTPFLSDKVNKPVKKPAKDKEPADDDPNDDSLQNPDHLMGFDEASRHMPDKKKSDRLDPDTVSYNTEF